MAFSPDYRTYPGSIRRHDRRGPGRRPAGLHAAGLQLDGVRPVADRHHRLRDFATPALHELFYRSGVTASGMVVRNQPTALAMIAMFAPLAFVLVLSMGVNRLSRSTAQALYWAVLRRDGRQPDQHLRDLHRRIRSPACSSSPRRRSRR